MFRGRPHWLTSGYVIAFRDHWIDSRSGSWEVNYRTRYSLKLGANYPYIRPGSA